MFSSSHAARAADAFASTESFTPPSEEIWNLFRAKPTAATVVASATHPATAAAGTAASVVAAEPTVDLPSMFTEEEYDLLPSTLVKAIRRTKELLEETERVKKHTLHINNELKSVYGLMVRHGKKQLKNATKPTAAAASSSVHAPDAALTSSSPDTAGGLSAGHASLPKANGFCRPGPISDDMCDFLGVPRGTKKSRVEVNNCILDYIKRNQLVHPHNAQCIVPDDKLRTLLSADASTHPDLKITYFSIQKYIKHHFKSASSVAAGAAAADAAAANPLSTTDREGESEIYHNGELCLSPSVC
jgi:chromatin remodeling complex protein RSC6